MLIGMTSAGRLALSATATAPRPQLAEGDNDTFKHRKASHERADPILQVLRALHRRERLKTSGTCARISKYTHFNKLILPISPEH